jgi:plastocyanin
MAKHIALIIVLALVSVLLIGCSSTSTTKTTSETGNAINVANYAFVPNTLTVKVGTTVTWTNKDSVTHTVDSNTGVFNSGFLLPGKTFSYTFNSIGTFQYHCAIHPYMTGTIIVQ